MEYFGLKRTHPNKGKKIILEKEGDCTVCTSHTPNQDGYIRVFSGKGITPRTQFLHRIIWEREIGPIPDGCEINHKCKNRRCCNTEHLEVLGKSEHKSKDNALRYKQRIEDVRGAIIDGRTNEWISKNLNVSVNYINRHRRELKKNV